MYHTNNIHPVPVWHDMAPMGEAPVIVDGHGRRILMTRGRPGTFLTPYMPDAVRSVNAGKDN